VLENVSRVVSLIPDAASAALAWTLATADNRPGWRLAAEDRWVDPNSFRIPPRCFHRLHSGRAVDAFTPGLAPSRLLCF